MSEPSLVHAFFGTAKRLGSKTALRHKVDGRWTERSWTDYANEVRRFGRALLAAGVGPDEHVAILGPNRPEWVIAALGAMAAGGSAAGIYATSTADQVGYIVNHAASKVCVVGDEKQLAKIRAEKKNLPALTHTVMMTGKPTEPGVMTWADFMALGDKHTDDELDKRWQPLTPKNLASLIYTSGTTGTPKAVMITHENCTFAARATQTELGLTESETMLSYLPLSHIAEQLLSLHGPVVIGITISFCEELNQLGEFLREVRPTLFFGVPRVWEKMEARMKEAGAKGSPLQKRIAAWARGVGTRAAERRQKGQSPPLLYPLAKKIVFSKVRERLGLDRCWMAVSSAAPIARSTLDFFFSLDLPVYEVYGMSEVTGPGTMSTPKAFRIGSVGKALKGTELKIAEDGEVLMRGSHICAGYMKDPASTKETIDADGWLHSGDIGEIDSDGFLRITDRKKDLFKTAGGKYIAPQPLESLLKGIPGISQAVVCGEGRKFAVALLTLDPDQAKSKGRSAEELAADPSEVKRIEGEVARINKGLPPYETIKKIKVLAHEFTIESGEMTPSLKIKRKVVNQRYANDIDALYAGGSDRD
jgi:long-subunit acyl-CoA synthetase (AMP-forming)